MSTTRDARCADISAPMFERLEPRIVLSGIAIESQFFAASDMYGNMVTLAASEGGWTSFFEQNTPDLQSVIDGVWDEQNAQAGGFSFLNPADDAPVPDWVSREFTVGDQTGELPTWFDPYTRLFHSAAAANFGLVVMTRSPDASAWVSQLVETEGYFIRSGLTQFTGPDMTTYIAGLDRFGDLILVTNRHGEWNTTNISAEFLRPTGQQTPMFGEQLVGFATPWNGLNLAGIDMDGHLQVVWTGGQPIPQWGVSDLTATSMGPVLEGRLSVTQTSWNGINYTAGTELGDVIQTWWAPALGGQWASSNLTELFHFKPMEAESLTSFIVGGSDIGIAGQDAFGDVQLMGWSPMGTWTQSNLSLHLGIQGLNLAPRMSSHVQVIPNAMGLPLPREVANIFVGLNEFDGLRIFPDPNLGLTYEMFAADSWELPRALMV